MAEKDRPEGFFQSDNVWVLIPLAGVSIPIFAVLGNSPWLLGLIGAVLLVVAVTLAARNLLALRHRHRLEEIAAKERLSLAERDRFTAIDRLVEPDPSVAAAAWAEDRPPSR